MKEIIYIALPLNKKYVFHEAVILKGSSPSPILIQSRAMDNKIRVYDLTSNTTRLIGKWQIYSKMFVENILDSYMSDIDSNITCYEKRRGV